MSESPSPQDLGRISGSDFHHILRTFNEQLEIHETDINTLNVFPVPDADTGTNSLLTVQAGVMGLASYPISVDSLHEVIKQFAHYAGLNARGNSGTILAEYFRGLANALEESAGVQQWNLALQAAADCARQAVLTPREGTILSVATAVAQADTQYSLAEYVGDVTHVAKSSLLETTAQLDELRDANVVDAGACVLVLFHAAVSSFYNDHVINIAFLEENACITVERQYNGPEFEVTFLLTTGQDIREQLQHQLSTLGDSITIAGTTPVIKIHVHTDDVQSVIELGHSFGEVSMVTTTALSEFIQQQ